MLLLRETRLRGKIVSKTPLFETTKMNLLITDKNLDIINGFGVNK
jgi:hypothetical protein